MTATKKMLEWAKYWLETAPLMSDSTKKILLDFCKEHGIEVNLPRDKS